MASINILPKMINMVFASLSIVDNNKNALLYIVSYLLIIYCFVIFDLIYVIHMSYFQRHLRNY